MNHTFKITSIATQGSNGGWGNFSPSLPPIEFRLVLTPVSFIAFWTDCRDGVPDVRGSRRYYPKTFPGNSPRYFPKTVSSISKQTSWIWRGHSPRCLTSNFALPAWLCARNPFLLSLQQLYLEDLDRSIHLTHQTSGNQAGWHAVLGRGTHICLGVMKWMPDLVEELVYQPDPDEIVSLIRACTNVDIWEVICFYESWFTHVRLIARRRSRFWATSPRKPSIHTRLRG